MVGRDLEPPRPGDEPLRQARVFASGVLAMRGNATLQAIVEEAAARFGTPIAAISIVDRDRQWFPASVGLDKADEPRSDSICAHAILRPDEALVIPDISEDPRFADGLAQRSAIRFYAGVPLVTHDRVALGAICLIDHVARAPVTPEEEATLRLLAGRAVQEIERVEHFCRFAPDAIEFIVQQIRDAAAHEDEALLVALDGVLQTVEQRLSGGARGG